MAVEAEMVGVLSDGRVYHNHYHFLFHIEGGKVFSVKEYMDTGHAAEIVMKRSNRSWRNGVRHCQA